MNVTRENSPSANAIMARLLDTSGLEWSVGGNAIWYDQSSSTPTHDRIDAARSGRIEDNEETWLQTTVTGPGALSFWWKVSSEPGYDYLEFYIDGVLQNGSISGEEDWAQKSYPIDAGTHILRWVYTKDSNFWVGSDSAWVDQVVWTTETPPNVSEITVQQGKGANRNLNDNQSSRDFGSVVVGKSSKAMVFSIKNDGTASLKKLQVLVKGKQANDFKLVTLPAKSVASGKGTQFKVIYKPSKVQLSQATLQIRSNDADEKTFSVKLTGKGLK